MEDEQSKMEEKLKVIQDADLAGVVHGGLTQYQHDVAVLERRIHTVAAHAHSTEVLGFPAFEVGARHFDLLAGRALVDGYAVVVRRYAGDDRNVTVSSVMVGEGRVGAVGSSQPINTEGVTPRMSASLAMRSCRNDLIFPLSQRCTVASVTPIFSAICASVSPNSLRFAFKTDDIFPIMSTSLL